MSLVWIDGRLVEPADATVGFADHGITVGDGAFETIRMRAGRPFAPSRHLARLERSLTTMGLPVPDAGRLRDALDAVASSDGGDGFLRLTVTGGEAPLGSPRGDGPPTVIVAVRPGRMRLEPASVAVVPYTRNERGALAGVKSTSYAENVMALAWAERAGAEEAIFANTAGNLCEGTGSNVFVELDGAIVTPPLSAGCLAGVTRELLLEATGTIEERDVPLDVLRATSEAFLTSTGREVQPIALVDGVALGGPCPGPLTQAARASWVAAYGEDTPNAPLDP